MTFTESIWGSDWLLVQELLNKYNFHDSNIMKLLHEENNLILSIDFCRWKQKDCKIGEDETKEISLKFEQVSDYIWNSDKSEKEIDYDTILSFDCKDSRVKIVLWDSEISLITFTCADVILIEKGNV